MNKGKILKYLTIALMFVILVLDVSLAVIEIRRSINENEIINTPPAERLYSSYYNSLTHREQLLYDSVTDAAASCSEYSEVVDTEYTIEEFQYILSCIKADRPDLFYVSFDELVLYRRDYKTKVGMVYISSKAEIDKMVSDYRAAIENACAMIDPEMSDFEKEVILTNGVTDACDYASVTTNPLEATSYGALVLGRASCEGYAYAAKELLNSAEIDSLVIYGKADEREHVWNMVYIDGEYYHLDITWNDPDNDEEENIRFHGYFNLSNEDIMADHSYDNAKGIIPDATVDNNYYKATGCYAASEEELEEVFHKALLSAVEEKRDYIEIEYENSYDNMIFKPHFTKALDRVNEEKGGEILYDAFSVRRANKNNNAVTIRIFYN